MKNLKAARSGNATPFIRLSALHRQADRTACSKSAAKASAAMAGGICFTSDTARVRSTERNTVQIRVAATRTFSVPEIRGSRMRAAIHRRQLLSGIECLGVQGVKLHACSVRHQKMGMFQHPCRDGI